MYKEIYALLNAYDKKSRMRVSRVRSLQTVSIKYKSKYIGN